MKKYFITKYITGCFLLLASMLVFSACDDSNDWDVDGSKSQMFTPVTFELARLTATSVDLRYSKVPYAGSYVIEVSADSLEFSSVDKTIEILVEDMEKDPSSTSERYIVTIDDLEAQTRYSARIKATSIDGKLPESKWGELTFKTISEQILNPASEISESSAVITWEPGATVTHITLIKDAVGEKINLTSAQMAEGKIELTDLVDNTEYTVVIYNGDKQRGLVKFTTFPKVSGDGTKYFLKGGENLQEYLDELTDEQVVLVLPAGTDYSLGTTLTVPSHMTSLTIWGLPGDEQPVFGLKEMKLDGSVSNFKLWLHNLEVAGVDAAADYLMNDNPSNARTISDFKIDNCFVHSFRGVFRMRGALTVGNIEMSNSIFTNISGYGLVNIDATSVSANRVSFTNNTVYKLNNTSIMSFKGSISSLVIDHCTFYDAQGKDRYIVNFDKVDIPSSFTISNSIFAASDASVTVRATNPKNESPFASNTYKTSDYTVADNYPLTGSSSYAKSSAELFEAPEEGNFRIMDVTIGGESQPGDPRWW